MSTAVAIVAATTAIISAVFVWLQVREMQRQTTLQREIAKASAQPYVWADLRVQEANGWFLELVVGNAGPTVATDVRVVIDPPLPALGSEAKYVEIMHERLASGIASLAPQRTLRWTIGPSPALVNRGGELAHRVRIDCHGPFGKVERTEYTVDMSDFREAVADRSGTLHEIAKQLEQMTQRLPGSPCPVDVSVQDD